MERIWLKSYPEGVPAEVDVDAFSSIVDMFEKSVTEFADRPAYVHMGATLTYAEVDRLSRDFAAFLREGLKLPRGARVALRCPIFFNIRSRCSARSEADMWWLTAIPYTPLVNSNGN